MSRNTMAWLVEVLAQAREAGNPLDADLDHCTHCHSPYLATRSDSRYCSNACRQAAYRQRKDTHA